MSIIPAISFKAGLCDIQPQSGYRKALPGDVPGYIFLYTDDDLVHFCWRPRNVPMEEAPLKLVMIPGDGHFVPYEGVEGRDSTRTNGRIFVLKFESSSQRHLFWLQSKSEGDASFLSPRDRKIGDIVDRMLQGEEPDVLEEMAPFQGDRHGGDDDETMEDVEGHGDSHASTGGAGSGATGGDVRDEGEDAREGGADGARA